MSHKRRYHEMSSRAPDDRRDVAISNGLLRPPRPSSGFLAMTSTFARWVRDNIATISETIYLTFVFYIGRLPMRDFDIWFHLKSGEAFVNHGGLIFTEIFSFAAQGRPWIPYEWLFQIMTYELSRIGLWTLPLFIGIFIVLMQWVMLRMMDVIYDIKPIPRLIISFLFFSSIYEYSTIRPHVLAYMFAAVMVFLILARMYKNKRWILATPLMTFVWTNMHSSSFLSWGLPLSYVCILSLWWYVEKKDEYLPIIRDLAIVTVLNGIVTILPPLGFLDYKLLWEFFVDRKFISEFIAEWGPITLQDYGFYIYSSVFVVSVASYLYMIYKKRDWLHSLFALPLFLMGVTAYAASRNVVLGMIGMLTILASSIPYYQSQHFTIKKRILIFIFALGVIIYYTVSLFAKKDAFATERLYFPTHASQFAKQYLHGHMFNDYGYGGYIEYQVYPALQVFLDGRADVFHEREMRDYFTLTLNKDAPNPKFKKVMDAIWNTYDIDFVIAPVRKHNVWSKVTAILSTDPNWALVFWDDDAQIFVRRDGKNDQVIHNLEAKVATPYLRNPFDPNRVDRAQFEYERMESVVKSAHTSNALGYILSLEGNTDEASKRFWEAINIDPTFESPYMNLAEIYAKNGDVDSAIQLYGKALQVTPDRGLPYIRLGQLYLAKYGNPDKVKKLWENGLKNTTDPEAIKQLQALLKTL